MLVVLDHSLNLGLQSGEVSIAYLQIVIRQAPDYEL